MIFKTFDSDIDKISAKWGVFGKSFYDFAEASRNRKIAIDDLFTLGGVPLKDAKKQAGNLWSYLYPSKETIQSQMIDVDALYPEIDDSVAQKILNVTQQQKLIDTTKGSWNDYFKEFQEGDKWQIEFVQNTDLQKASIDDVKKSYEGARQSALAHNAALKQQTLGAKATTVAMKALSIAGNMLLIYAISKGIQIATELWDNYIHAVENAREKLQETTSELESVESEIKNINSQIDELLAKDTPSLTDENDLKRLREENQELENRRKILEAQKALEANELNREIEKKYNKQYKHVSTAVTTSTDEYGNMLGYALGEDYINLKIAETRELLALNRQLTDDERDRLKDNQRYLQEQGTAIIELTDGYTAITNEEKEQKAIWEGIIEDIAKISDSYGGVAISIFERLQKKFTGVDGVVNRQSEHREVSEWLSSLSDEDKKIMLTCELEETSLNELKQYLAEQKAKIEADTSIKVSFDQSDFNEEIKSYEDGYSKLISAQEEWNESKAISASTFVDLEESGLLEYIQFTSEGLEVNTEKLLENAQSTKDKAVADLHAAMTSDLLAIAMGNTESISAEAQNVIAQLGENTETAGNQAMSSVSQWATLGDTISKVMADIKGEGYVSGISEEQKKQMSSVYDFYKNLATDISNIDITLGGSGSGSKSKSTKDTKNTFDWIETKLSRIQRTITNLGKTVSATYKQWSTRNNALAQEMSAINQEIATQQQAMDAYMAKANSVGLPEPYKTLVEDGGLRIDEIADEALKEQIQDYQEWYNKALDCSDAIQDLQDSLAELAQTKFDNISKQYDDRIAMIEHHTSMLEGYVNRAEAAGFWASEVYYQKMAEKELENINQLQSKYNDLTNTLNESVSNGLIEQYSEAWYEMRIDINDVEQALQQANTQLVEFNQTLQQIRWDIFDRASDYKDLFIEESNFLAELISRRDLYNEVGNFTADGLAVQGLHAVNYNAYMEQSEAYAKEILKLNEEIANDPNDLELIDRRNELIGLQQEAIKNSIKEKESIQSLYEDGYNKMLDSLQKVIDKRKELLNSQKD